MWISNKKFLIGGLILAAVATTGIIAKNQYLSTSNQDISYRLAKIKKGDLVRTISANGTLEPEEAIDIGAQVAALIVSFGKDINGKPIDFGSKVKKDSILAYLDDEVYQAEFTSATAREVQAKSQVYQANIIVNQSKVDIEIALTDLLSKKANLLQAEANYGKTKNEWERTQRLGKDYASEQVYDAAYWDYKISETVVKVAKTGVEQAEVSVKNAEIKLELSQAKVVEAKASLTQAEAAIISARRNLEYCIIKAPVDGIIIDRRVNVGQTVVAGLSAPSLFLLAKDLSKMQVWVSVNEADIGQIVPEQNVKFSVDAFPNKVFEGKVDKIRLNASMSSNVVLYIVEVNTDNSSGVLIPYLTCDVKFEIERKDKVLYVPNTALRYTPSNHLEDKLKLEENEGVIWVANENNEVSCFVVKLGMNDGVNTEISSKDIKEGLVVLTGERTMTAEQKDSRSVNPFMPKFPRRNKKRKSSPHGH